MVQYLGYISYMSYWHILNDWIMVSRTWYKNLRYFEKHYYRSQFQQNKNTIPVFRFKSDGVIEKVFVGVIEGRNVIGVAVGSITWNCGWYYSSDWMGVCSIPTIETKVGGTLHLLVWHWRLVSYLVRLSK
jgi:hypothetical protein